MPFHFHGMQLCIQYRSFIVFTIPHSTAIVIDIETQGMSFAHPARFTCRAQIILHLDITSQYRRLHRPAAAFLSFFRGENDGGAPFAPPKNDLPISQVGSPSSSSNNVLLRPPPRIFLFFFVRSGSSILVDIIVVDCLVAFLLIRSGSSILVEIIVVDCLVGFLLIRSGSSGLVVGIVADSLRASIRASSRCFALAAVRASSSCLSRTTVRASSSCLSRTTVRAFSCASCS